MRDLYKRLDIEIGATEAEITTAIAACQHTTLKSEASAVLTVKSRRDEYDKLHVLLRKIGQLRARLGLTHGQYWQGNVANDFSLAPDSQCSRHDALVHKLTEAVALHNRFLDRRRHVPWLIAGGIATLTIAASVASFLILR